MNLDDFPLSMFEVDCDGSVCGSGGAERHVHPRQDGAAAIGRVRVVDGQRVEYGSAEGVQHLVMVS
jgi:hypothetical protein